MTIFLRTVIQLLVMLSLFMAGPCMAEVTGGINPMNCPEQKRIECQRGMRSDAKYVNIYSTKFGVAYLCDTKTDGGGWIVIQRRFNRDTSFDQNWEAYKNGFGHVCSDYWIGNKYLNEITHSGRYDLMIDMIYKFTQHFAHYIEFFVDGEEDNFRLHVDGYNGSARDALSYHNDQLFSTPDSDNDKSRQGSCAREFRAGWWYKQCHRTNLNGRFEDVDDVNGEAVTWDSITDELDTLTAVEMKIRKHV